MSFNLVRSGRHHASILPVRATPCVNLACRGDAMDTAGELECLAKPAQYGLYLEGRQPWGRRLPACFGKLLAKKQARMPAPPGGTLLAHIIELDSAPF